MEQVFRSNIELFFTEKVENNKFYLIRQETKHAVSVLRKKNGDVIYATDGKGNIFKGLIMSVENKILSATIVETYYYEKKFPDITFFVPLLRNKERMRFALEKLTELGFTNIVVYSSKRTIPNKFNFDKWQKIIRAALKQSLNTHLPELVYLPRIHEYSKQVSGTNILLDQAGYLSPANFLKDFSFNNKYNIFVGPEGDFTEEEKMLINPEFIIKLAENRLRSETAVISFASLIALLK